MSGDHNMTELRELNDPLGPDTAYVMETVVQVGILPVVTVCGLAMNVINMVVFVRLGLSDRINLCLFSLALSDSGFAFFLMLTRLYSSFTFIDPALGQYWKVWSVRLVGVYAGFVNTSSCVTLLIALERCVCVVWPLRAKTLLSARHTTAIIIAIFCTCLSFCCLHCFKFRMLSYRDPVTNTTRYAMTITQFYRHHRQLIDTIINTVFNFVVPTVSLTVVMAATSVIIVRMRSMLAWRRQATRTAGEQTTSPADRREAAVTRMLVAVCLLYTVCTLPTVVHAFCRLLVPEFFPSGRLTHTFYATISLVHLSAVINSSGNCPIYVRNSSKFREMLHSMCGLQKQGKAVERKG